MVPGAGGRPRGRRCPTRLPPILLGLWSADGRSPDPDGIRVVQLARHELVVAFRSARLREALERERGELTAVVDGTTDLIIQVDERATGRPAQPGGRAAAGDRGRRRARADVCARCSAARSRAATDRTPVRCWRS